MMVMNMTIHPQKEEWVMTSATAKPQCEITHEALAEQGCYPL